MEHDVTVDYAYGVDRWDGNLWSILYRTTTGAGESDSNLDPVCVQLLANNVDNTLAEGDFGEAFRSSNDRSLLVITEMYGPRNKVETCKLSVYEVAQVRLDGVLDILVGWCDEKNGDIDASWSTCGQLLSVLRTYDGDFCPSTWALFDLRSTSAKVLFEKDVRVSHKDHFTVEHIFFTIDNEIVVKVDPGYVSEANYAGHKGSPMAQYVEEYFSFLKDVPAFAKRVVIQYVQERERRDWI